MLLWLLLLHLAIHLLTATRDASSTKNISSRPIDNKYVIKKIDFCPDVGYFFKRESAPNSVNPGPCYLCFCQGQNQAICWRRENKRCDVESFHFHDLGKRDTRVRRSPAGFSDIFFRDATKDVFDLGTAEQCKPFESSFSDGCPPADWCIGCTVCDCDANGRWDCHILSFCPEKKGGKKLKKRKQRVKISEVGPLIAPTSYNTTVPPSKLIVRRIDKSKSKPQPKRVARMDNIATPKTRIVKKEAPTETTKRPKKKIPLRYRKIAPKNVTVIPKIINKNIATRNPIDVINRSKMQGGVNANNETLRIAQQVVKRVMAAVQRMVKDQMINLTKHMNSKPKPSYKKINKRQVRKGSGKNHLKKFIIRNKRNALAIDNIDYNMNTPRENTTKGVSKTAVTTIANTFLVPDRVNTATPDPILNDSDYYKYSIGVNYFTTYKPIIVNDVYETEKVANLASNKRLKQSAFDPTIDDGNEITSLLDAIPEANDLKFKKWSFVKIMKDKHDQNKVRNVEKLIMNKSIAIINPIKKVHTKDIERKFVTKKFNIVKVINSHMMALDDSNYNQSTVQAIKSKISDLQSSVSKLFKYFPKNGTIVNKSKHKRVGIARYLKKLFSNIFNRKKTDRINEFKVIETLCDTFGPCKVNKKDKLLLKYKLKQLNNETLKILKTIQIIKGLLQLVNIRVDNEEATRKSNFGYDIQKLNHIIRGTYLKHNDVPLSATQLIQMDYIKKNTKQFVQSVSRFVTILNDIVAVLIKDNNDKINNYNRILRDTEQKEEANPFKNFRNLLLKYNLAQNEFMKKMYKQLSEFENQIKERKVSDNAFNDLNNSVAIETFSRNIITNLRQLKRVAQTQTSSGRVKRKAVLKEDSIEYVLMVMEYLMKQNYPLDAAPVNDGIDLLIDAIRNAPDIKPIKKKVLEYTVATPVLLNSIQRNNNSDESNSVTDIPSKKNFESRIDNSKDLVDQILEEDKENEERSQFDRKAEDTTESVYYLRVEDTSNTDPDIVIETVSHLPVTVPPPAVREVTDNSNTINAYKNVDNSKKSHESGDNDNKMDEIGESNESNDVPLPETYGSHTNNKVALTSDTTAALEVTEARDSTIESDGGITESNRIYLDQSIESNEKKFVFDTKTQIDWIEENFGMDPSRLNTTHAITTTMPSSTTNVDNKTMKPIKYDVSGMTSEVEDKKKKKINAEEVMLRKQMDLLNSLDYGTEMSEFEDSGSKDGSDDKFTSDSFPAYFV